MFVGQKVNKDFLIPSLPPAQIKNKRDTHNHVNSVNDNDRFDLRLKPIEQHTNREK